MNQIYKTTVVFNIETLSKYSVRELISQLAEHDSVIEYEIIEIKEGINNDN